MADPARPAIVFDGAAVTGATADDPTPAALAELEEEREKHRARAERFNSDYVDPASKPGPLRDAERHAAAAAARSGFVTGIDVFDETERAKAAARAARFGVTPAERAYVPVPIPKIDEEDEDRKKKRAERFGTTYDAPPPPDATGLMEVDVLEARRDAPPTIARRPDAVHLYGVDVMSTSDCLSYFSEYGPRYVEWIDDSSCNVVFADAHSAKRAIMGRGAPLPPDAAVAAPDAAGLDPSDLANAPFLWHKGDDFVKGGTPIPLVYRMAVATDVKPTGGGKLSRRLWRLPAARALEAPAGGGDRAGSFSQPL